MDCFRIVLGELLKMNLNKKRLSFSLLLTTINSAMSCNLERSAACAMTTNEIFMLLQPNSPSLKIKVVLAACSICDAFA